MKILLTTSLMMNLVPLAADWIILDDIPFIQDIADPNYEFISDVGGVDWSQVIGRKNAISLNEAKEIANSNPQITYFFYMKGYQMILGNPSSGVRVFGHGDAVFFTGEPQWGSAPDLADGYVKINRYKSDQSM